MSDLDLLKHKIDIAERKMRGDKLNRPITIQCERCGHPVDSVEFWRVEDGFPGTEIVVKCHGDRDRMLLTDDFVYSLPGGIEGFLVSAIAFRFLPGISIPKVEDKPDSV